MIFAFIWGGGGGEVERGARHECEVGKNLKCCIFEHLSFVSLGDEFSSEFPTFLLDRPYCVFTAF